MQQQHYRMRNTHDINSASPLENASPHNSTPGDIMCIGVLKKNTGVC